MNTYNILKDELLKINHDITSLFSNAKSIPGMSGYSFGDWENTCSGINKQISEEKIRVAVVGPIKSGKSTFLNALFKGDYLKRGAGVITSIVTRIHSGDCLKAKLVFKSWEEVNLDIEHAMVLFPSGSWRSENGKFDIRRKKERRELQQALGALGTDLLITNDTRNANSVLMASYLKGYDRVQEIISSDTVTREYEDNLFAEHMVFVGDDNLAVYLKDIELEIDFRGIDRNIEIADCQGSDSPNPLHLAMIQDYLLLTHLIIYVISSRTGLRQADIKFLSMIKKMGIMDNILFVINCDFSEHESIDELNALVGKIAEELSLIKPDPEIFTLSALFNLFGAKRTNLSEKDRRRLEQWKNQRKLAALSDRETERFEAAFERKLTRERYSLLLKNHIERLGVISSGMDNWIRINQDILARNASDANEIVEKIKHHQNSINQIKSMIKNTLDGSIQKIRQELKIDVDRFFDVRSGDVLRGIIEFIRGYNISYHQYEENLKAMGFSNTLYLVFQEFRQALDTFMAETINPEVIRFAREGEKRIREYLESVAGPYGAMVHDALVKYADTMGSFGIDLKPEEQKSMKLPDMESIKSVSGLTLPPAVVTMRYSAKIKTEAAMRLGFYTVVRILKKLLRKPQDKNKEEIRALKDGVSRMKRETEKSIIFHFKDYRENIKFQYIFKLVEAASNSLYKSLLDRFQAYSADLSQTVELISKKRIDKQRASEVLKEMEQTAKDISERIQMVREKIEHIV